MKNEKYKILSYKASKELGLSIKPTLLVNKRINVSKKKLSISAKGMMNYPSYFLRHERTRHMVNTPSYFADKILW